ncbi:hypothetical protein [Bradyrhizobium canariense]|uniref:hypothetical protein n=1 Tax=Bradyrhizobium canariense TaxID=255045 RepID=UPI001AECDB2A|nr:hypothetical protein [Bradyrhizobium canariense]
MKTLASHLAKHLDRSPSTFVELYRALREGLFAAIADEAEGFSPPPVPADFLDRDMTALLIGRSGPQGGVAADPYVVALLVIASLVDSPRADVARRAFDIDGMAKAVNVFGNTLRPTDYYEMFKYGRAATNALSDDFMLKTAPTLAQELGGSSAGKALSSFYTQFVGGKPDEHLGP